MRHILLTGGTGVIGSALIPRLLADPDVRLSLIVRARSEESLDERKRNLLEFCQIGDREQLSRLDFVRGDVCEERLGLDSKSHANLAHSVTGVIHAAGNVKLNQSLQEARRSACGATEHILAFARRARRLERLDAVSTIGVAGRMPGLIPERRLVEPRRFHNTYEQAKAESEELLWQAIENGLPITIHRPSMVVGDSRTGKVAQFQVFYYLAEFLTGSRTCGLLPDLEGAKLDILPSDVVAEGIAIAARTPESVGRALHLCSGPGREVQLRELANLVRELRSNCGERLPKLWFLTRKAARRAISIAGRLAVGRARRSLATLPYFLDYLDTQQQFEVERTSALLCSKGWAIPLPIEYLRCVFSFERHARCVGC